MIVAVFKEKGPTSRNVLNKIKAITKEKKVGHAGTLDPLAEGVLVVGIGRESTKRLHAQELDEKEYLAEIFLGAETKTDDREGEQIFKNIKRRPSYKKIKSTISSFLGEIEQIPPQYSAVKVKGKEAYKYARDGKSLDLKPRKVEIKKIDIASYEYPLLKVRVTTGKGVYVRSLARDIGKKLSTGGYLYELKRVRVGTFKTGDCVDLSFFEN